MEPRDRVDETSTIMVWVLEMNENAPRFEQTVIMLWMKPSGACRDWHQARTT